MIFVLCIVYCRQIERIQLENPDKKVAVVTFGSDVYVLGDGSQAKVTVTDSAIKNDFDALVEEGKRLASEFTIQPLTSSYRYVSTLSFTSYPHTVKF